MMEAFHPQHKDFGAANFRNVGDEGYPTSGTSGNGELNLDVQSIMGNGPGVPTEAILAPSSACSHLSCVSEIFVGDVHALISPLLSEQHPPLVVSFSLGQFLAKGLAPTIGDQAFVNAFVNETSEGIADRIFILAGLRGITLIAATGDGGSNYGLDVGQVSASGESVCSPPFFGIRPPTAAFDFIRTFPLNFTYSYHGNDAAAVNTYLVASGIKNATQCCDYFTQFNLHASNGAPAQLIGSWHYSGESGNCTLFPLGLIKNYDTSFTSVNASDTSEVMGGPDVCYIKGLEATFKCPYTTMQQFPAASPFFTAVGATTIVSSDPGSTSERAVNTFGSAGGFNPFVDTPSYQREVVTKYLTEQGEANLLPREEVFNRSGRAFPDVAFLGKSVQMFAKFDNFGLKNAGPLENMPPSLISKDGTSAAAPQFGGVISLLNEVRLAAGHPPMGFLNPWLYSDSNGDMFNDITIGMNNIPRNFGPGPGTKFGFRAAPGWDAVTGLGTPRFMKMVEHAMAPFAEPCPEVCRDEEGCPERCSGRCPWWCPRECGGHPALEAVGCSDECCGA
jgi:hypothetical protein